MTGFGDLASGNNSIGRVSPFQGESCEFESRFPLQIPVAQGCVIAGRLAHIAQPVERVLGKDEVTSSSLVVGSIIMIEKEATG